MNRTQIGSGSPWEDKVGYCRAIRVGNVIEVAGTTAVDGDKLVGKGDLYAQTKFVLEKIENALIDLGASMEDVVRTRSFVTDISRWQEFGRAHGEKFSKIKPVSTLVEVKALIDPELLIEIEVTAMITP